jgi:squalene-hopene/tetraprenyl-beta-curcumene cyclase
MAARILAPLLLGMVLIAAAHAAEPAINRDAAAKYLDGRAENWFSFKTADRGQGATNTSCLCCHTVVPYALARPALKASPTEPQTPFEKKLLAQTTLRVENWRKLDTPALRLMYDHSEEKKKQSLGTESVLNALMLASAARERGDATPDATLKTALANLWHEQLTTGEHKGSWDWLDFGEEPWESSRGRYYGASLAAIAVETAPGFSKSDDAAGIAMLRDYLKHHFAAQPLFNKVWAFAASDKLGRVLSPDERKTLVGQLFAAQQADGGWNLASLGPYRRRDGTGQPRESDAYATAIILGAIQGGKESHDPRIARGLAWLRSHQEPTGEWRSTSLNARRDPASNVGKFMSDAATAYAVLALTR